MQIHAPPCYAGPSKPWLVADGAFKVICVYLRRARAQRVPHLRASASKCRSVVALPLLPFRPNEDDGDIFAPRRETRNGNCELTTASHGGCTASHGVTRRETSKATADHGMRHGLNTDLHGTATSRRFWFQFNNKRLC